MYFFTVLIESKGKFPYLLKEENETVSFAMINLEGFPQEKKEKGNQVLPQFRKDLKIIRAPNDGDGSPAYNLYDPVRARYFRLNWGEALIFQLVHPGMTMQDLVNALNKRMPTPVTPEELVPFFEDAKRMNLLATGRSSEDVSKEKEQGNVGWFKWLITHYLYIRIPLFSPDAFLNKTIRYVEFLGSKYAVFLYFLIAISGFIQIILRFEEFVNTFTYFFNWEGFLAYSAAIIAVKIFHELGHAYAAKYYGVHIPVMGVCLIILWPVMYTDVTDAWKLSNRYKRFAISFAGVAVELALAGLATWGWALSSSGVFQSVCYLVASSIWVTSLAVNLNPCMRFDGYYLLSDIWGIDNLQNRAFEVTRWRLRQFFLGLDMPAPEPVTRGRIAGMIVYTLATWIYRLTLYLSIALIVYLKFTKAIGVFLFFLEIAIFIVGPIIGEVKAIWNLRKYIKINKRLMFSSVVLFILSLWFFSPTPNEKTFSAITIPVANQKIFVPLDGTIEKVFVKRGDKVRKGEPLIELRSNSLLTELRAAKLAMEILQQEIVIASLKEKTQVEIAGKQAELRAMQARFNALEKEKQQLIIRASLSGTIYDWDEYIRVGRTVAKDQVVGQIAESDQMNVVAYVPEKDVDEIHKGQEVTFLVKNSMERIPAHIAFIHEGRDIVLKHEQLASIYKGDLPATKAGPNAPITLIESYYVVDVEFDEKNEHLSFGQLGYIEAEGPWRSRFLQLVEWLQKTFWRESSL